MSRDPPGPEDEHGHEQVRDPPDDGGHQAGRCRDLECLDGHEGPDPEQDPEGETGQEPGRRRPHARPGEGGGDAPPGAAAVEVDGSEETQPRPSGEGRDRPAGQDQGEGRQDARREAGQAMRHLAER